MARPKIERTFVQLRLTPELGERAKEAAKARHQPLATDLVRRIEESLDAEAASGAKSDDANAAELLTGIESAAAAVTEFFGDWRTDPFAHEVLALVVGYLVARDRPKGEPVAKLNPDSLADVIFGTEPTPASAAKTILGMTVLSDRKRAKSQ